MVAQLDGRPADEWLPAVTAYRRAGLPFEDLLVGIMLGNEPTPERIEELARGTVAYQLADVSDGLAEVRSDLTAIWRKAAQRLRHSIRPR